MSVLSLIRPLMAGVLHSFEPDHVTAISVLATENAIRKEKTSFKMVIKASQWALGHSVTLLLFGPSYMDIESFGSLILIASSENPLLSISFCRSVL